MKIKFLPALLLLIFLASCAKTPVPETTTLPATVSEAGTTEPTTLDLNETAPHKPAPAAPAVSIPNAKLTKIELNAPEGQKYRAWMEEWENPESISGDTTYDLSPGKKILSTKKEVWDKQHVDFAIDKKEIYLVDTKTGKKELLLEGNGIYGEDSKNIYVEQILDENCFLYVMTGWEWTWGCGVYDVARRKDMPLEHAYQSPILVNQPYLYTFASMYDYYDGPIKLAKTDLRFLDEGRDEQPEDTVYLLADVEVKNMTGCWLSPDGKTFFTNTEISDTENQKITVYPLEEGGLAGEVCMQRSFRCRRVEDQVYCLWNREDAFYVLDLSNC